MKNNIQSIGIFDSGIGGLTVANAISKCLPNEKIIYFGDTQHIPYGDKSKELIQEYSIKISKYLIEEKQCKVIVIACNTASAVAYDFLKEKYLGHVPIINVIDPMVELVINRKYKKIGIIATRATVQSKTYQQKLKRRCPSVQVSVVATPLLATMIEENFVNDNISKTVIKKYLSNKKLKDIEALVLGCTHYPLISSTINQYYDKKVILLKSGNPVAKKLKTILEKENLLNLKGKKEDNEFLVTNLTTNFEKSAKKFYGEKIHLKEVVL